MSITMIVAESLDWYSAPRPTTWS